MKPDLKELLKAPMNFSARTRLFIGGGMIAVLLVAAGIKAAGMGHHAGQLGAPGQPGQQAQAGAQDTPGGGFLGMGAPAEPQVQWTTFTDPSERAFSLQVPAGWQVEGGMRRFSSVDVRPGIVARSPDGSMEIFIGDQGLGAFTTPNSMTQFAGLHEGSVYQMGYGNSSIIASYRPGDAFAQGWGAQRIGRVCGSPRPIGGRPLPEADRAIDFGYQQGGVQASNRSGEADFDCNWNGAPGAGYVFSSTQLIQVQNSSGLWMVSALGGFAGRADHAKQAAEILAHMTGSFQFEPQWVSQQQGMTMSTSRIVSNTQRAVEQSISSSFDYKNASRDRAMEHWAQATRGTATFNDPVNGPRELENTEHQWRLSNGSVVGTNSSTPPEQGATELPRAR
jgi:hypothetical protein